MQIFPHNSAVWAGGACMNLEPWFGLIVKKLSLTGWTSW